MVSWGRFAREEPELATSGMRLYKGGDAALGYIATVARDGRPRMAPVCPIFADSGMYLSVGANTPKLSDLINDGRYVSLLL